MRYGPGRSDYAEIWDGGDLAKALSLEIVQQLRTESCLCESVHCSVQTGISPIELTIDVLNGRQGWKYVNVLGSEQLAEATGVVFAFA